LIIKIVKSNEKDYIYLTPVSSNGLENPSSYQDSLPVFRNAKSTPKMIRNIIIKSAINFVLFSPGRGGDLYVPLGESVDTKKAPIKFRKKPSKKP
jgi:hypothetical protein